MVPKRNATELLSPCAYVKIHPRDHETFRGIFDLGILGWLVPVLYRSMCHEMWAGSTDGLLSIGSIITPCPKNSLEFSTSR